MKYPIVRRALRAGTQRSTCKLCGKEDYISYNIDDDLFVMGCESCRRKLTTSYQNQFAWEKFTRGMMLPFYVWEKVEVKENKT